MFVSWKTYKIFRLFIGEFHENYGVFWKKTKFVLGDSQ